jgi:predicted Zn-dependent protease
VTEPMKETTDHFYARHARTSFHWMAGGLVGIAALVFVVLKLLPGPAAFLLPEKWREAIGEAAETSMTAGVQRCQTKEADLALSAMAGRLADGNGDLPSFSVRVFNLPVVNAFALPGGRIVLTMPLIAQAETPEEVAGVLAHELGHAAYRHPEAELIRQAGLTLIVSALTNGGGSSFTALAGSAAILSYSRSAEADADAFAVETMEKAAIDPMGLKHFFEKLLKDEGRNRGGVIGGLESAFSTHPGTEERIKTIHPLPDGIVARPVLDAAQWKALKAVCG